MVPEKGHKTVVVVVLWYCVLKLWHLFQNFSKNRLKQSGLQRLEGQRMRSDLVETFNIVNRLSLIHI